MTLITKPDYTYVWASGGAVVAPNDTKKQLGWVAEAPPFQYDNWLQNRQDQMLAHINQRGMPAWDALTNYEAGSLSYVQGSDGKIYKSVAASGPTSVVSNPTTDVTDTYWTIAFADVGAFLTQAAGDGRYTQRSNNLSDLTNAATARTNLGIGTISTQSAASVNITGGTITGITDLAIADGGTGASTASAAFTNIKQPASETVTGVVELATLAEMATGTSTSLVPTVAGVTSVILGVGQTWQDVTASRASGVTYTNTTGRPIQLYITGDLNDTTITVGGVPLLARDYTGGTFICLIIPVGATYTLSATSSSDRKWMELR